jgi:hypothetical protein
MIMTFEIILYNDLSEMIATFEKVSIYNFSEMLITTQIQ